MNKNLLVLSLSVFLATSFSAFGIDEVYNEVPEVVADEVVPDVIPEPVPKIVVPEVVPEVIPEVTPEPEEIVPVPEVVRLSGGMIEPKHVLTIPLGKLQKDIRYDVTCNIYNTNNKYKRSVPLNIYLGNENVKSEMILLNDRVIANSGLTSTLSTTTQDNSYKNVGLYYDETNVKLGYSYLKFINLDNELSIRIEKCVATPQV